MPRLLAALACALTGLALSAAAQIPATIDTARVYALETAVVTADRSASILSTSTAAVSVISGAELEQMPVQNLDDALETTPGFAFLHVDGLGFNPQATVRGFYGGGETEYVVVLLDGRPLNQLAQGLVNWNLVPLEQIERVEVVRGGASSLYGDAAIGSVVNLVTHASAEPLTRLSVEGGSFGSFDGALSHSGRIGLRSYRIYGTARRVDGYREHDARDAYSLGGSLDLRRTPDGTVSLSTLHYWRTFEDPGPLTQAELDEDRRQEATFYRFDETEERTHRLTLDGRRGIGTAGSFSAALTGELRHADVVRTLPLAPVFADTKNRVTDAARLLGNAQVTLTDLPLDGTLTVGADGTAGSLGSDYYAFLTGPPDLYRSAMPARGELDRSGTAARRSAAGFAQLDVRPTERVRLTLGGRADWIRDSYAPDVPADEEKTTSTNAAFSPKAGVNVRYLSTPGQVGHLYANVTQSFKAPTLDQLYDQRTYPFSPEFPPITISNGMLEPQFGTSYEIGAYHHAELAPGLAADLTLALYQIDMKDELDFSFETFRYENIAESRHRGLEAGLKVYVMERITAFANYTYQGVTAQSGTYEGNFVKAVPRDFIGAGVSAAHRSGLRGGLKLAAARRIVLDDENTIDLPNYTTVDARLGYRFGRYGFSFEVLNLFDEAYSSTGFPDPAGTGLVYFYPAAERSVRAGLQVVL